MQGFRGHRSAALPGGIPLHRHMRNVRRGRGSRQPPRPAAGDDREGPRPRRQPVGRAEGEFRHDDQAVPRRPGLGERPDGGRARRARLHRRLEHLGGAARLLPRRRRRLRRGVDPGQARQALDLHEPRRVDQAASLRVAHPSGNDEDDGADPRARHRAGPGRGGQRRHEPEHAQRADPSPADHGAPGEVQHGVLHGHPAPRTEGRPQGVPRRGRQPPGRAGDDHEDPFRRSPRGGGGRLRQDDHDHRHKAQGRADRERPRRFRQGQPGQSDDL